MAAGRDYRRGRGKDDDALGVHATRPAMRASSLGGKKYGEEDKEQAVCGQADILDLGKCTHHWAQVQDDVFHHQRLLPRHQLHHSADAFSVDCGVTGQNDVESGERKSMIRERNWTRTGAEHLPKLVVS